MPRDDSSNDRQREAIGRGAQTLRPRRSPRHQLGQRGDQPQNQRADDPDPEDPGGRGKRVSEPFERDLGSLEGDEDRRPGRNPRWEVRRTRDRIEECPGRRENGDERDEGQRPRGRFDLMVNIDRCIPGCSRPAQGLLSRDGTPARRFQPVFCGRLLHAKVSYKVGMIHCLPTFEDR
jgi:hypothetical protein